MHYPKRPWNRTPQQANNRCLPPVSFSPSLSQKQTCIDLSEIQISFEYFFLTFLNIPYVRSYRTIDGSCNNLKNAWWGQANIGLQRILFPSYEDGLSRPRGMEDGDGDTSGKPPSSSLPSPRDLSEALIPDRDNPSRDFTLLLMQWGQFLDHDLTHTPVVKGEILNFKF